MNLQNDDDYGRSGLRMPTVILAASAAIFVVLAIVLAANGVGKKKSKPVTQNTTATQTQETYEDVQEKDTLTAADLDFWDMYNDPEKVASISSGADGNRKEELEEREAQMSGPKEEVNKTEEETGPENDGNHTKVTHIDGSEEWVAINSSLKLNTYDDTYFQKSNGILGYYINGKKTTKTGVDISQYTTEVGWNTLVNEVDFVMIRVGARGYDSGQLISDSKFVDHVVGATKAGIPIGLYFSSQATTEAEAKEEVKLILSQITAAQTAIANANTTNTNNQSNSNTSGTNNNTNTNSNSTANNNNNSGNYSTPTNLVRGIPILNSAYSQSASDGTNTTYMYADGTAVTTYSNGDIVTAYSNGGMTTNHSDGSLEKKDNAGNTIKIDSNGNYSITNSSGNVTGSGITYTTTGLTSFQVVNNIPNNTTVTTVSNTTTATNNTPSVNTSTGHNGVLALNISYPIAIDMHLIANDTSRIEKLSAADRSAIIKAFCTEIKAAGYSPLIYGDKEMLLTKLNLSVLGGYDIWLGNEGDIPDYPYLCTMWKYDTTGRMIKSLNGDYGLNLCFVDYATR